MRPGRQRDMTHALAALPLADGTSNEPPQVVAR